jgi:hypothetical protein
MPTVAASSLTRPILRPALQRAVVTAPLAAVIAAAFASVGSAQGAPRTDVIHGRVIGPDSTALESATVSVLAGAPPARTTRTDANGRYSISIENGPGTYTVVATMLGYAPQRRTIARQGVDTIPAVDFKLVQVATQLGAVRSTGARPKPARSEVGGDFTPGASNNYVDLSRGLTGDVTGDLTAALSMIPGVTVTPSATGGLPTVTAFGQTPDQNSTVLNGLVFGGSPPRDGFSVNVVSSTYDPAKGGFSGVQLSLRMNSGSNFLSRTVHATLDAPALQATTPAAEHLGTLYDQQVVSGTISGPIAPDKAFYAFSYQVMHRGSALTSLVSESPASLLSLRMNPDSVARLLGALSPLGLDARVPGVPGARATNSGQVAARFDFTPNPAAPQPGLISFQGVPSVSDDYYLQLGGSWRANDGSMIGATSVPAAGSQLTHRDGWLQLTAAKYFPRGFLNEASASLSAKQDVTDPYLDEPTARVLVTSALPDGTLGVSSLQLGGASAAHSTIGGAAIELRDQLSRYTWDRHHQMALTAGGTLDRFSIDQAAGLGSFSYNSIADFTNGAPASFSRVLNGRRNEGSGLTGALGVGDIYAPSSAFRAQFGVRLEANHLYTRPAFNPAVDSVFALRTDHVPSTVALMPMAGFSWQTLGRMSYPGIAQTFPRGNISGGVREYRGSISTQAIDGYSRQTGLPDATQQLFCVGAATPAAPWGSFAQSPASIPSQCADGTTGTPLAQTTPPVALYAPGYSLSRSWRPDLNVSYTLTDWVSATVGGTYVVNLDQPGVFDVNFVDAPRFSLGSERGRPVYTTSSEIVPATGALPWTDSRASALFAHVGETRSDLQSHRQYLRAGLSVRPSFILVSNQFFWYASLNYTHASGRDQLYGFSGTTDGDPRAKTWSPSSDAEHAFNLSLTMSRQRWFNASITARAQSGIRFTPGVFGDVNGDGYATNDRAFVFDPATVGDTGIATPMARLLSGASPRVRSCLTRQLGAIAGRNSCVGGWSFNQLIASISPDPYRVGLGNRGNISILFTNILGGVDQLLHGSHLRGWGQFSYPDATLLTVRGFDPATNRFLYTVNPQFGSSSVYRTTFRSPFVMTVDFRIELGPDRETQYLEGALRTLRTEGGESLTLDQFKSRISPRAFNPLDAVIQRKDTFALTPVQIDSLNAASRRYAVVHDSLITDLARYLLTRHGDYGGEEVRDHWHATALAIYERIVDLAAVARSTLTEAQMAKLRGNPAITTLLTTPYTRAEVARLLRGPVPVLP